MRISASHLLCFLALIGGVAVADSRFSTGPPASMTGAPGVGGVPAESNCGSCHQTYDEQGERVPNVNLQGGGIELSLPGTYVGGQVYPIEVRVRSDSTEAIPGRKWGFQLTAFFATTGQGAGTFQVTNLNEMQVIGGDPGPWQSRSYVEHVFTGTQTGATAPVTWQFQWQAPSNGGTVYFAAAANAADGTFDPGKDFIYTKLDSVADFSTPAQTASWGSVKRRWR
jgi:hypothetical protein